MRDAAGTPLLSPLTAASLLAGMLLASRLPVPSPWWLAVALAAAGAGFWLFSPGKRRLLGALVCGFGLLAGQGAWRLQQWLPSAMELGEAGISGRIESLPRHEARRSRFDLRVDDDDSMPEALRGRLLRLSWYDPWRQQVDAPPGPRWRVHAGERWRMRVKLRAPRGLRNPGGFDGERQMLLDGVIASGHVRDEDRAQRLAAGGGITAWREAMSARILRDTRAGSARFVAALALGDTRALSRDDWQTLRATGLTHLIAISGFHVGLVGMAAAALLWALYRLWPLPARYCPRRIAMAVAAALGALAYLFATGASLPTLRTVLMIGLVAGAMILRRQTGVAQTVAVALILMLLADPLSVLRAGFWLSFGGVAWLAWCLHAAKGGHIRQFVLAQAVVTLGLLPLTVTFFGQASAVAPFANLLAVPWWSLIVVPLALLGTLAECLHPGFGAPLWTLAGLAFDPGWPLFEAAGQAPLALWWLPEAPWFALPLALLAAFAWLLPRGMPGRALAGMLWLPLLWPGAYRPAEGEVELVQADVGQGLAMLVRTRSHALLYDTGPAQSDGYDAGEHVVVPMLHARGVGRVDAAILSHADNDHAGGLQTLMRALPVARVLAPPGAPVDLAEACIAGEGWEWDGVRFRFLHPPAHFPYLKNQSSCVLRIETAHGAVLLTGDIDTLVESRLLRLSAADLRADVITMPHHGSGGSSGEAFVAATGARLALVSAGYANRFRHPREKVLGRWHDAGALTPLSFEQGALTVRIGPGGLRWQGERTRRRRFWDGVSRRASAERAASPEPRP
ncbi:DNA internalization-related competence protein ComEC/Rec2 [Lysobacter pythonis]|uniref:DNA internalization-related competence protein ComEC/Rec2 n=1 Tax=Solilutibacter pythonis TaxID=2483112 RepID=A0A3M2HYT1_9GAMM|nr:DNA internalization-related competence protein ComEC/Rec2 [Lysobacter pythonis]RMH94886.1 DNA internalization-related competence protein ComEC/Rec2 [Lysobacter pythonis]